MTPNETPSSSDHRPVRNVPMTTADNQRLKMELSTSKRMSWPHRLAEEWGISTAVAASYIKQCQG